MKSRKLRGLMVTDAREISVKYFRALSFLKLYQDKRELGAS